ncbi:hypothetical protein SLH49_19285 [Cognatiyoonia sp. IB215446]|uniref:hypothetical protein n=1 Tax=Cognatiyoonia sp. IB215446 TaxID=3097355 RepID=UPI002A15D6A5|nr:hypothetical protein [Cognatiyoonia sp. IB215446]MDX8350141.1 hypothetical protein [Cognatiyoonia sp. IB215446]
MSSELLIQLVAPFVAILIAILTTVSNLIDRRRSHRLEKDRLDHDRKVLITQSTGYFLDKYDFTKLLLSKLSKLSRQSSDLEGRLAVKVEEGLKALPAAKADIEATVQDIFHSVVDNQLLLTERSHKLVTEKLLAKLGEVIKASSQEEAIDVNIIKLREMRSVVEQLKVLVRQEFEQVTNSVLTNDLVQASATDN